MITPKRTISDSVLVVRERRLPISGEVLVSLGDSVPYDLVVLRTEIKGDLQIIRLAEKLGMEPEYLREYVTISPGDQVSVGQRIFEKKSLFSFFNILENSKFSGQVEFISESNGHIGIREPSNLLEVRAFVPGKVIDISKNRNIKIESHVGLLQGAIGYGGEVSGKVYFIDIDSSAILDRSILDSLPKFITPTIVVGGMSFSREFFLEARDKNIVGIVTSSLQSKAVREVLGTSVFGTSPAYSNYMPVVIVIEGFGNLSLSSQAREFFKYANGKIASMHGLTQVRAGAIRPELIVHEPSSAPYAQELIHTYPKPGDVMRVVRGKYFGKIGKIISLPENLYTLESGVETHVAELDILGEKIKVALANVESM